MILRNLNQTIIVLVFILQSYILTQDYSLNFDGVDDYISFSDSYDINLGTHTQRTIDAWFKVTNKTISSHKQTIYEEGGGVRGLNIYIYNNALYCGGWNIMGDESTWNGTWLDSDNIESFVFLKLLKT